MRRRVRRLRAANPGEAVEVRAEDGARLGLRPVARRAWWLEGCRPTSCGRAKSEWLSAYGFARPEAGESLTVILPRVTAARMAEAPAAFAAHADPEGEKVLAPGADDAGWHRARRPGVPADVRLHSRPPCTPELPPVGPDWASVREAVADDAFGRPT